MEQRVDDVAFINTLLDKLIKDFPVDPRRLYVTGISNGGMMTERLGIELAGRFAAIAPVVATLFGDEKKPDTSVSAIIFNGLLDKSVPNQGGLSDGRFANAWDGTPAKPAVDQPVFWANANGCNPQPEKHEQGTYVRWQYHCPPGRAVEFYLLNDSGHAWPGGQKGGRRGDEPSLSINATDVIWEFFKAHAK
jgi:polyhydroxybutyrate depolymerase